MEFWQTIESSCHRPLVVDAAASALEAHLRTLSADDVAAFCAEFDRCMDDAFSWDLWGVAYLINGGCSDDTFMDFRSALIALGRDTFDAALADAESLLDLDDDERTALFDEGMLYVGPTVHEALTGHAPVRNVSAPAEPSGTPWDESAASLRARFPKAWAIYGWEDPQVAPADPPAAKPWWKFW